MRYHDISLDPVANREPLRCRAFALVLVLLVLTFVVLLVTTLGLLTRVDTRVSVRRMQTADARRHALLALERARDHLQRFAGPDQRVTATAELLGSPALRQAALAGVWDTREPEPRLLTWLVNGNDGNDPLAVTPESAPAPETPAAADEVFVVDRGTVSADRSRVKLTLEPLRLPARLLPGGIGSSVGERTVGRIAYWIADEGVKASLGFGGGEPMPSYDNRSTSSLEKEPCAPGDNWIGDADARRRLLQLIPRRPRFESIFNGFDADAPGVAERLTRALTRLQLALVDPAITPARLRGVFHDVTLISRAVLSDTGRQGGRLRIDLSDTPDVESEAVRSHLRERPFENSGEIARHVLRSSTLVEPSSILAAGSDASCFSVGPVLTECLVRVRIFRQGSPGRVAVRYERQVELWNPYSSAILAPPGELEIRFGGLPRVVIKAGEFTGELELGEALPVAANGETEVWAPGEVRVLRGGTTLTASGRTETWIPFPGMDFPPEPITGGLRVDALAVSETAPLDIELRVGGGLLARYRPSKTFHAATAVDGALDEEGGWMFGYAFELRRDLGHWTDGGREHARDPRWPDLAGDIHEVELSRWSDRPDENLGQISFNRDDAFSEDTRIPVFELPRQELASLGSLQHLIGPRPGSIGNPWGAAANALFDRAFVSTIPRWAPFSPAEPPSLPSPYLEVVWDRVGQPPLLGHRDATEGSGEGGLLDGRYAARHLLIRGAFNFHSTSEVAWRVLLSGLKIPVWKVGGAGGESIVLHHAFFRFSQTAEAFLTDPRLIAPDGSVWRRGVRELSGVQVAAFAKEVVGELRRRAGLFPTTAAFLNAGVLARAIAAAGINGTLNPRDRGTPAWLTQADVMTAVAPVIGPRSDTFLVRAYGDGINSVSGAVEGRAWCEAVLQRFPDLTDPIDDGEVSPGDVVQPGESRFPRGRRFEIVGFRWLSDSDI